MATFAAARREAINFRDALLRNRWPDDSRVAGSVEAPPLADARAFLADVRAARLLLGVWSEAQRGFVYPDFQFDLSGKLRPEVSKLLMVLPDDDDRGGWRRAFWLYSPHALLDGLPPAEVFVSDPGRVLKAAAREFSGDCDSSW
ncbi:hypothetical protein LMG24238_06223 [Paraburkholderia sediminicola]|uniref:Antitoxin Xre/MbcA/ParS-like toxin-binding domain-containing protein n=1 Tax=Paraburkholderia sediminicola TaxID=458836 RepID=A0A6J5CIX4_9BURK|nr:hypothetical protein [Paraburkholderia sediminicola]CAB3736367.1 hypothetical protein LMG24238_06223 [Paraburkholderia sediminicola]